MPARCRSAQGQIGLAYVDAHADFATPEESQTGSVASMGLALAVGHGDSPLARLAGPAPLVRPQHVALIGRRDGSEPSYGHAALSVSGILDLPESGFEPGGVDATASAALVRVGSSEVAGFWIHVDADVLNPQVMPAVGSPEPGGPGIDELAAFLAPLVGHPKALGMALTLYDPRSTRIGRARYGSWSCLTPSSDVGAASVADRCVGLTSSARRVAPGRTRRVRNERPRASGRPDCWQTWASVASPSTTGAMCRVFAGGLTEQTLAP